jgi:GNAT superfamily N-acetyltransferase
LSARYGLEIRSAQASDAPYLSDFLAAAGHAVASGELARRLEALRASPGVALMSSDWGPPNGLIVLHWAPGLLTPQPTALISTLLVGADARRRGIGRALLKAGSQAARSAGCGALQLIAPEGCDDLIAFGRSGGFTQAGAVLTRGLRKGSAGVD